MIEKWITDALEYSNGTHDLDDVMESIRTGEMQLWANAGGCVVTQLTQFPKKKVCFIFLAGGDLSSVKQLQPQVSKWAMSKGCELLTMIGRKGWSKVLPDWTVDSVCMTRIL